MSSIPRLLLLPTVLLAAALVAVEGRGQFPPHPSPALPPLMYVRLAGPNGMNVTVYRGTGPGQTLEAPVVLGLRPGYAYRVALSDIPGFPGQLFFPTLEVRGSLLLPPKMRHADFPATLNFSAEDFAKAQLDKLVKKAVILERPDSAVPLATQPRQPIEIIVPPLRDPVLEGQLRGQPLVVLQMGQRHYTPQELAYSGVPGTILLPGEKFLPLPRFAPPVPWGCFPVTDPLAGPVHPSELLTVPDGGDTGLPAGWAPGGKLLGLDPSDTVAEYTDSQGRRRLVPSNRVCLTIPRYVVMKGEINLAAQVATLGPEATQVFRGQEVIGTRLMIAGEERRLHLEVVGDKQKLAGIGNTFGTAIFGRVQGTEIKVSLRAVEAVDGVCVKPEPAAAPDRPLRIIKWPDRAGALVGDVVTFYLRYTNQGGQPISDVVVLDSLTPRFEYVPGSAKSDRAGAFTTQPNEAGSTVLRWEFAGTLAPRQSGTVSFQVRVR